MSSGQVIPAGEVLPPLPTAQEQSRQSQGEPAQPGRGTRSKQLGPAAGRFVMLNRFVDTCMAGLTRSEIATWWILYRDTRDGVARTAASDIARRGRVSRKAVQKALAKLKAKGLVEQVYRGGFGRGLSIYRVSAGGG